MEECTSCSHFDDGLWKVEDMDTSNHKTREGRAIFLLMTAVLTFVFTAPLCLFIFPGNKAPSYVFLALALASVAGLVTFVALDPIRVIYAGSYLFTRVTRTPPILDPDTFFPGHKDFQDSFVTIREEVEAVMEYQDSIPLTRDTFGGENDYIGSDVHTGEGGQERGWRFFMLTAGKDVSEAGARLCPKTVALIQSHPEVLSAGISILPGKVSIPQHVGYYKGAVRYMLPIIVPEDREDVYICLNDEKLVWEEGVSVVFDDTYPHKVYNKTEETRVVLYMDVARGSDSALTCFVHNIVSNLLLGSSVTKAEMKRTEVLEAL